MKEVENGPSEESGGVREGGARWVRRVKDGGVKREERKREIESDKGKEKDMSGRKREGRNQRDHSRLQGMIADLTDSFDSQRKARGEHPSHQVPFLLRGPHHHHFDHHEWREQRKKRQRKRKRRRRKRSHSECV